MEMYNIKSYSYKSILSLFKIIINENIILDYSNYNEYQYKINVKGSKIHSKLKVICSFKKELYLEFGYK